MSDTQVQEPTVTTLHDVLKHTKAEHPDWCSVCHKQSNE